MKNKIIEIGKLLWDKGLVTGFNGNISARIDANTLLITATGSCLGYLVESDILTINTSGEVIGTGKASTEKFMHTEIYKNFPQINAVVHTHPTYTNGFFLANESFSPKTFEAKFYLGEVKAIVQHTPSVTEMVPVVQQLKINNIVALKNHGVVAVGPDLFNAFVLIQELEEQVKMAFVANIFGDSHHFCKENTNGVLQENKNSDSHQSVKKYKLFSKEQIDEIVKLVNNDAQMQELGSKTAMNMSLAVILDETKQSHRFTFENGRITQAVQDSNAEFVINAPENIWRMVFNREIDPFVATTQKKMSLQGDFARISKWYAPCSRIFQLWTKVPVE